MLEFLFKCLRSVWKVGLCYRGGELGRALLGAADGALSATTCGRAQFGWFFCSSGE